MENFFIDETLYEGRPIDLSTRQSVEIQAYELLDELDIKYQRLDHSPAASIEDCQDIDRLLDIHLCKNLFLCNAQKTAFYLLMMPGDKKFKTAAVTKQLGCSRLSFARPEDMAKILNLTPGSVSVLGLMNDHQNQVQLLIDKQLITDDTHIGCHPCMNTSSLKICTTDLLTIILPALNHSYYLVDLP